MALDVCYSDKQRSNSDQVRYWTITITSKTAAAFPISANWIIATTINNTFFSQIFWHWAIDLDVNRTQEELKLDHNLIIVSNTSAKIIFNETIYKYIRLTMYSL